MRDIVATIQPDQDDIVRAPLSESICVQGAPGTGKTAVGLHRAAYLLYTHAGQLARSGVLVVGPNRAFLRYIEQVLPTLGEVDVDQTTRRRPDRPGAGARGRPAASAPSSRATPGWPRCCAGRCGAASRKPTDSTAGAARRPALPGPGGAAQALRRRPPPRRGRRGPAAAALRRRPGAAGDAAGRGRPPAEGGGRRQPDRRRDPPRRPQRRRCAPSATRSGRPGTRAGLVAALFTDAALLARAARGVLDDAEQAAAALAGGAAVAAHRALDRGRRRPGRRGGRPAGAHAGLRPRGASTRRRTSRRCSAARSPAGWPPARSPCWATWRRPPARGRSPDWAETLAGLGRPDTVVRPLTRGYRVPGEVLDFANRLLPAIAPGAAAGDRGPQRARAR